MNIPHPNDIRYKESFRDNLVGTKPTLCVVNYNGEPYLDQSLGSAVAQHEKFSEILLIDNASEDMSLEIVRKRFPSVRVIELKTNSGPAAARNIGLRKATTGRVLFLDNDVILDSNCVDFLMQALDDIPQAVAAMPRVLYDHKRNTIQFDGADNHFLGLMILHNENLLKTAVPEEIRKIGSIVTSCFLIDRRRYDVSLTFDESFFIYFEDHDFGVRMRLRGYELLAVPAGQCFHREGTETISIRKLGGYSKSRVFWLIRNRWVFILKTYSLKSLIVLFPIFVIYEMAQLIIVTKKGWFGEWRKALVWISRHFGEIVKKRRAIQKSRITSDKEILCGGKIPFRNELIRSSFERLAIALLNRIAMAYWRTISGML